MKCFTLFNDISVAHYTALNNWMTVKWLESSFRFCPGIFPDMVGQNHKHISKASRYSS